jgi:activator of HSP90 ATPase
MTTGTRSVARVLQPTRRQVITGGVLAIGSLTLRPTGAAAAPQEEVSHSAEAIHQEPSFKASRKRVYEALIDAKLFDKVTRLGAGMTTDKTPTAISRHVGGAFTLFDGYIVGRIIELVADQLIVQAWRVLSWDRGIYSIARFELVDQGSGSKVVFDHTGFPKGAGDHLAAGWKEHYWDAINKVIT